MTQNVDTNTLTNDFETARLLALSHLKEDGDNSLVEALMAVRNTCSLNSLNRLLVLVTAVGDPRFDQYSAADAVAILRDLKLTDDLSQDVETFLSAMKEGDEAALLQAEKEAAEIGNPFRQAAIRLLTQFGKPTYVQVQAELDNL
jgi:hypothetical protein